MVEYYKTKNGYFYKLLKNGDRKRISSEEYKKRTKTKRQMGGNEPILEEDIMYQDDLVCILKPNVKKGILVWSRYKSPEIKKNLFDSLKFTRNKPVPVGICSTGLKTGKQLKEEGIEFGRKDRKSVV